MRKIVKFIKLKYKNFRLRLVVCKIKPKYYKISFFNKLKMRLKGFMPDNYYQYDFKNNNPKDYLTEVDRLKTRRVNGDYNVLLDDKLVFYDLFHKYFNIPKNLAWINNGVINNLRGNIIRQNDLRELIKDNKKVIIKPNRGGGGFGVVLVSFQDNDFALLNNETISWLDLYNQILTFNDYIITPLVEQADYSKKLYENTTNTIRLISIYDKNKASIVYAIHRIGTKETIPVDNASKGGIFSKIDLQSGKLTYALSYSNTTPIKYHPDSNTLIEGVKVPFWDELKKDVIKLHEKFSYIPFLGWDIVITKDSWAVIEINASTDLIFFQMFEPMKNHDLGKFYKQYLEKTK